MKNAPLKFEDSQKKSLYQWDINQRFIVTDPSVLEVHYYTSEKTGGLLRCLVKDEGDKRVVAIPNIILCSADPFRVYTYKANNTIEDYRYSIIARPKPDNYIYEETDVVNMEKYVKALIEAYMDSYTFVISAEDLE